MTYPEFENTPIKEIVLTVSYSEILDTKCFEDFTNLASIKSRFREIKPSLEHNFQIKGDSMEMSQASNGYYLRNKNEVIQLRKGLFSFHFLNGYCSFDELLDLFVPFWAAFDEVTNEELTINSFSARYINVIETDRENKPTHLVQLYPKQSSDRVISKFQNSIEFRYKENSDYIVKAVSTKLNEGVLLDITVSGFLNKAKTKNINLKSAFMPLRAIKNKAFFDSITARALLKYIPSQK